MPINKKQITIDYVKNKDSNNGFEIIDICSNLKDATGLIIGDIIKKINNKTFNTPTEFTQYYDTIAANSYTTIERFEDIRKHFIVECRKYSKPVGYILNVTGVDKLLKLKNSNTK